MGGRAMIDWIHAGPTMTAAFLGSLVECVEALTIVLAVGTVRGWRSALLGTAGGVAVPPTPLVVLLPAPGGNSFTSPQFPTRPLPFVFRPTLLAQTAARGGGEHALR